MNWVYLCTFAGCTTRDLLHRSALCDTESLFAPKSHHYVVALQSRHLLTNLRRVNCDGFQTHVLSSHSWIMSDRLRDHQHQISSSWFLSKCSALRSSRVRISIQRSVITIFVVFLRKCQNGTYHSGHDHFHVYLLENIQSLDSGISAVLSASLNVTLIQLWSDVFITAHFKSCVLGSGNLLARTRPNAAVTLEAKYSGESREFAWRSNEVVAFRENKSVVCPSL